MNSSNVDLEDTLKLADIHLFSNNLRDCSRGISVHIDDLDSVMGNILSRILSDEEINEIVLRIKRNKQDQNNSSKYIKISYSELLDIYEPYLPRLINCIRNRNTPDGTMYAFYSSSRMYAGYNGSSETYPNYQPRHKCIEPGLMYYAGRIDLNNHRNFCRDEATKHYYQIDFNIFGNDNGVEDNTDEIDISSFVYIDTKNIDEYKKLIVEDYNKTLSKYGVECSYVGTSIIYHDI